MVLSEANAYSGDTAAAYLYDTSGTDPVSPTQTSDIQLIATETITNTFSAGPEQYTFTPTTTIRLAANTQYWIVLADNNYSSNHSLTWWDEQGDTSTAPAGGIGNEYNAKWNGTSWTSDNKDTSTGYLPVMEVNVSPVAPAPEPATFGLMGSALVGIAVTLRRRSAGAR